MLAGSKKIDPPVDSPVRMPSIAMFVAASEANDGADRDASAIGRAVGIVQADIVKLRAHCQVRQNTEIHAAANAIREVGIRAPAVAKS
jgi:hypothetical protein